MLKKYMSFFSVFVFTLITLSTISFTFAHTLLHSSPTDPAPLTKGVPSVVEKMTKGTAIYYSFSIPVGATNLAISTTGSTGDADIYLNKDKARNTKTSTWKSIKSASTEKITLTTPVAGTYFLTLRAYTATTNTKVILNYTSTTSTTPTPIVMCTMDAKICGDGTSVGRTGPDCQFVCPASPTPAAVNGSCGLSSGVVTTSVPTSNLCSVGNSSLVSGTGPYAWTCSGTNGGLNAICNAPKAVVTTQTQVNGVCGTASSNQTFSVAPTNNLCSSGSASTVTSSDLFSWTCSGVNGGTTASCRANKTVVVTPVTPVVSNGGGIDKPTPNANTTSYSFCSSLYTGGCEFTGLRSIRYGNGTRWVYKDYLNGFPGSHCNTNQFPGAVSQSGDHCEVADTIKTGTLQAPVTPQHGGMYPTIDLTAIPLGSEGSSILRIEPTTDFGASGSDIGAFRIPCTFAKMAFNDPIVYPGQSTRSHLHTFFGNVGVTAYSTAQSLATTGNSTCAGGIANRSSYWVPSIIDTATGKPIAPSGSLWYYKTAYGGVRPADVKAMPAGLRMIAGSMNATASQQDIGIHWECHNTGASRGATIPTDCQVGDTVSMSIGFPQCWDGVNLDSANHQSHMAFPTGNGCPSSHPVPLPELSLHIHYKVNTLGEARTWRLSSDHSGNAAGLSIHADFFEGWNRSVMNTFVTNCLNPSKDCHAYLLGNGTTLVGE